MRQRPGSRPAVDWWGGGAVRLHAILVVGVSGAGAAAWFEWTRALEGHEIAWAYSFEWPLFALVGIHIWWRLLHPDATREGTDRSASPRSKAPAEAVPPMATDDPELAAWEAYLARLHAADPPGGPPARNPV